MHSNKEYWIAKIEDNMARDKRNDRLLADLGWTVFHFWEKEVLKSLSECLEKIEFIIMEKM